MTRTTAAAPRRRRRLDLSATATIPPLVLLAVIAAAVVAGAGEAAVLVVGRDAARWMVWALWATSGAAALVRPVQRRWLARRLQLAAPTEGMRRRLEPLWGEVAAAAGRDPHRWVLMIEPSDAVNASAAGGHLVAVTRGALRLPDAVLQAVLAHELGHHLRGHALASWASTWLVGPIRLVHRLAGWLHRAAAAVVRLRAPIVSHLAALAALALRLAVRLLVAVVTVAHVALAWAGRRGELAADRFACDLGWGEPLDRVLAALDDAATDDRRPLAMRLRSHHPRLAKRRRRLQHHLERLGASDPRRAGKSRAGRVG